MKDWVDKVTNGTAYLMSLVGMTFSQLTFEQWYFTLSLLIGAIALGLNFWHKRAIQQIAEKQGINVNETH